MAEIIDRDKIDILLSEYESLYSLYSIRVSAIEKRIPIAAVILVSFLSSITLIPEQSKVIFLCGIPLSLIYLIRTTVFHIYSFEDLLRRVDEIECKVNQIAGEELIIFESQHPSKGLTVGGRTGRESVNAILLLSIGVLFSCGYLFSELKYCNSIKYIYYISLTVETAYLIIFVVKSKKYKYVHQQTVNSQ